MASLTSVVSERVLATVPAAAADAEKQEHHFLSAPISAKCHTTADQD